MNDVRSVTLKLFERYFSLISKIKQDHLFDHQRLSAENLKWMCETAINEHMPLDKMNRWLGFVQGCLAMRGIIDVDHERNYSRNLYHSAYKLQETDFNKTLEREENKK